ncbi:hypothetical protein QK289_04200 [Exiguobacterium antarcticum]|uniref:Uncharacterized protein n=1 Tax=Exiguobacterium antarcticum TaxID=132920 RepID=A0ABT6QZS5_9BACL|nr:hypothetical protein [Exiguobacterium antarcticum]MDI3234200.1 hypothetical protein [Exiguobacterium antarcticum]
MITAEKVLRRGRLYVEDTYLELGVGGTGGQRAILVEAMALLDNVLKTGQTDQEYEQGFMHTITRLEQVQQDMQGIRFMKERTFTKELIASLQRIAQDEEVPV